MNRLTALTFLVLILGVLNARPYAGPMAIVVSACAGGVMSRRLLRLGWTLGRSTSMRCAVRVEATELCGTCNGCPSVVIALESDAPRLRRCYSATSQPSMPSDGNGRLR